MVNIGLVVLDKDLRVCQWNRWMELHSGIPAGKIINAPVFDFFSNLKKPAFKRNCKSVLTFGNFSFFSQKLHKYLFPFKPEAPVGSDFKYMQQNCTMGPLRDENNVIKHLFISVEDVTEMAAYEQKLLNLSIRDGLTGIFNRRFFEGHLKEEFERHKRYKRPLSLIMIDIDFFKKFNDEYGHQCGDFVLKTISEKIASGLREIDILTRYGGEEFSCLLMETDLSRACLVSERIRKSVFEYKCNYKEQSLSVTISLGVAEASNGIDSPDLLIRKADDALYEAKKTGRNKVVPMSLIT